MYKHNCFLLVFLLWTSQLYSQNLNGILAGFIFNKVPTDRPVVGAKWVNNIGITSEGLSSDKIINSRSLNSYSFNKETNIAVANILKSILGLDGYSDDEIDIKLNRMSIEVVKDLYSLPLIKNEMFIYEAIKVESFDLLYKSSLESTIKAVIPVSANILNINMQADNKKRITLQGHNLYIAYKIIKINKVENEKKMKKMNSFKVDNLLGYNIEFNNTKLINAVMNHLHTVMTDDKINEIKYLSDYIAEYSNAAPITVSFISSENGNLSTGIFKSILDICYCKSFGDINGKMFLINSTNDGEKITFDYLYLDNYRIYFSKVPGVKSKDGKYLATVKPDDGSKISVLRKTYYISNVLN